MQLAQSCHAALEFAKEFPEKIKEWMEISNYICCVSVSNEEEIHELIEKASTKDIRFSIFREPDLDDQITAIALEPSDKSRKLCSCLKLALR